MDYLTYMFVVLLIGVSILMAGSFILNYGQGFAPHRVLRDSLAWSAGFFVSFATEFLLLVKVL